MNRPDGRETTPAGLPLIDGRRQLLDMFQATVNASNGRLKIVAHQENTTEDQNTEAATFLKLDGIRLGRDLEQYAFMSKVLGWEEVLPMILEEVVSPLAEDLPESHKEASRKLQALGDEVYVGELKQAWDELFVEEVGQFKSVTETTGDHLQEEPSIVLARIEAKYNLRPGKTGSHKELREVLGFGILTPDEAAAARDALTKLGK